MSSSPLSVPATAPSRRTTTRSQARTTSSGSEEIISTASPCSDSSEISPWTSAFAPTSMPRVGSSRMRIFGSVHRQRASSTFCWLPPESSPTGWSGLDALMFRRSMKVSTSLSAAARDTTPRFDSRGSAAATMFSRIESPGKMPSALRSSGRNARPSGTASAGERSFTRRSSTSTVPSSGGSAPKIALAVSVRPEPMNPASPTVSPRRTSRTPRAATGGPTSSRGDEDGLAVSGRAVAVAVAGLRLLLLDLAHLAAEHQRDQLDRGRSSSLPVWTSAPSRSTVTRSQSS